MGAQGTELKGRVALVTGGSSRIGAAICRRLGGELGATVVVGYRSDEESARSVVEELRDTACPAAEARRMDITDYAAVTGVMRDVASAHGGIDVLVNNAALGIAGAVLPTNPVEDWTDVIETNLIGAFHCIKAVSLYMLVARTGSIVNIASIAGLTGIDGLSAYCASKAGLIGMTRALAREYAPHGVRVNAVAPGYTADTGMVDRIDDERLAEFSSRIAMGRLGRPDEIADAAAFLATDRSSYVTGQTLVADGGLTA
ncbi:3-oxoacyl-ACP reductase family protein [Spirillospora sp. NPDC049024]